MKLSRPWAKYKYKKSVLSSGVRVVTEYHPNSVAASVGFFVGKGTRDELKDEAGLAHFVEHMVFKRTKNRTAFQISRDMEEIGADINAYTSRESTSFVAFGLSDGLSRYVDVLSDVVMRPTFASSDIETERDVVIQEIRSSEDQLEDSVFDRYFQEVYKGSNLGLPILGSVESIESVERKRLLKFYQRQYINRNLVVAAAGRVDHDELCSLLERFLTGRRGPRERELPAGTVSAHITGRSFTSVVRRRAEQSHILIGADAPGFRDHRRFDSIMLNGIIGGGLTSRLYQEVREQRGLAYAVYSQLYSFVDAGTMLLYAATEPKKSLDTVEVIFSELKKLVQKGFRKDELEMVRTQVRSGTVLGADDPDSRMQSLAINELVFGRYRSLDEVLSEYERVKEEGVRSLLEETLRVESLGVLLMGPGPDKAMRDWIEKLRDRSEKKVQRRLQNKFQNSVKNKKSKRTSKQISKRTSKRAE